MSRLDGRWLAHPWGRQRAWEAGDGRPVLAIHGLGGSGRYFERLGEHATGRFHLIAPDLAGFGASDKPDIPYDRGGHLENLDAVVRDVDEPIVVVGHSLGGVFAALWTARDPSRVAALAILCAPFPSADGSQVWVGEPELPRAARIAAPVLRTIVRALAVPVGMARGYPAAVASDYGRQTFRSRGGTMWSALYDPSVLEDLEGVRALDGRLPTLIEHAEDDRTVRLDAHLKWVNLLPGAEHRIIAGGHQVQLQDRFTQL
ncbi:MAG: alpha/beta hydrolase, partial [Actinomycetota bacterium]